MKDKPAGRFYRNKATLLLFIGVLSLIVLVGLLTSKLAPQQEPPLRVGLVLYGEAAGDNWNQSHYQGMKKACEEGGAILHIEENVLTAKDCVEAVDRLADKGVQVIALTSSEYLPAVRQMAKQHENIQFTTSFAEVDAPNVAFELVRMYSGRYLSGILAGMVTKTGTIGYICSFPNPENNRNINAFTIGLHVTNPEAQVKVVWTGSWADKEKEIQAVNRLADQAGVDIITYNLDDTVVADQCERWGIDFIGAFQPLPLHRYALTSVGCHWDVYYRDILERYRRGALHGERIHWLSMRDGAVYLAPYNQKVEPWMRRAVETYAGELSGARHIFMGPIVDNQGNLRCNEGEILADDTVLHDMDWLVKGVEVLGE